MWPSTTKYFSPFFSYTVSPPCQVYGQMSSLPTYPGLRRAARVPLRRDRGEVEAEVVGGILRVGEHDRPVVGVDHPAVVGGHVLLEFGLVERAGLLAQCLRDLVVDDLHPADRVDPDHRRKVRHLHVGLRTHNHGDHRADLVVHQGEPAPVGRGAVGLERALRRLERGHCANSFGTSRLSAVTIPAKRLFAASRPSSNRGGLASGCDHSGCSVRAAAMARGTQVASQSAMIVLLWSANSRSSVSSSNIGMV